MDRLYFLLYKLFSFFVKNTPFWLQKILFFGIARVLYTLDNNRKKVAKINLDFAYGASMEESEKIRIIKRCYQNLLFYAADSIKNHTATKEEMLKKVTFKNREILDNLLSQKRKIIFISGHYSNWEIIPFALCLGFEFEVSVVGRKFGSPLLDGLLSEHRERMGVKMLDKMNSAKELVKTVSSGRVLGLVVDQNTADSEGLLVNFFGKEARHTPTASNLAIKYDCAIVPVFVRSNDFCNFELTIYEPYITDKSNDKKEEIQKATQFQADITECIIREKPDEWFWFHRRWKNQYEHIYS